MTEQVASQMLLSPAAGSGTWNANTLREGDFVRHLSDTESDQLLGLADGGLDGQVDQLRRAVLDACENGPGFIVLRGLNAGALSVDAKRQLFANFCIGIGPAVTQNKTGDLMCDVKDQRSGTMADQNIRGFQTNEKLELHTDSSDILSLYCHRAADSGGDSVVVSSATIYNTFLAERPEYLSLLYAGVFYDSRGQEADGALPSYRNPIYHYDGRRLSCRYYLRNYVEPAYDKLNLHFSFVERDALDLFETIANRPENRVTFPMQDDDLVFYSNNAVLHGRSCYQDSEAGAEQRWLFRVWLNPQSPRALPAHFAKYRFGYF